MTVTTCFRVSVLNVILNHHSPTAYTRHNLCTAPIHCTQHCAQLSILYVPTTSLSCPLAPRATGDLLGLFSASDCPVLALCPPYYHDQPARNAASPLQQPCIRAGNTEFRTELSSDQYTTPSLHINTCRRITMGTLCIGHRLTTLKQRTTSARKKKKKRHATLPALEIRHTAVRQSSSPMPVPSARRSLSCLFSPGTEHACLHAAIEYGPWSLSCCLRPKTKTALSRLSINPPAADLLCQTTRPPN